VTPEIKSLLKDVEMCDGDRVTLDAGAGPNYKYNGVQELLLRR
jgi:hypothetical protein